MPSFSSVIKQLKWKHVSRSTYPPTCSRSKYFLILRWHGNSANPTTYRHLSQKPRHTLSPMNFQRQNLTLPLLAIWLRTTSKTSLCRMALGKERKTPAISLSLNDRLIIVFVCHKSLYNRQHVCVLFSAS